MFPNFSTDIINFLSSLLRWNARFTGILNNFSNFYLQIQFIVTGFHASVGLFVGNCNFPKYLIAIGIPQDIFMFALFWDFYKKSYLQKRKGLPHAKLSENGVTNKNTKDWMNAKVHELNYEFVEDTSTMGHRYKYFIFWILINLLS